MWVELNYIFFSLLLVVYSAWRYSKRRERVLLYLTLGFTFLTLSTLLQILSSSWWIYISQLKIQYRLLEISALALFAGFVISAIIALREVPTKTSNP